ncbi:uncharacterized protein LOC120413026 [Culex pipiens pallens]|uniref:uncharacterized protein LOC120413026 n=1 Tax=Culex pipiens pallens TaxID=42434 RepID=UPI001953F54B|nr:uncharacterized protein LOC120413026 [Culex pipiens pallens]
MSNAANNRPLSKEALAAIPVLRSLIISEKGTSTLKRILNDYAKEEGEPLPFRKFGFPSAVEYLKATDEFVLRTHMGETTIFVKPKADTAHIQKMVAAQKPAKVPVKRNPAYSWKNPQLRYSNQTGYMPKPLPVPKQYGVLQKNPNNPLKRFFPSNCTTHYPKISIGNENVPPKPSVPPKVVPSLATPTVPYPKVVSAVKVETRETKPIAVSAPPKMNENVPPPVTVTQQAYVRPMLNNNYYVKRENPVPSYQVQQSVPKNPCAVQNQNHFPSNPFQNDRFVLQPKNNICTVQSQPSQFPTNPFNGNVQCPPGFTYRQPIMISTPTPPTYNIPTQAQYQGQNIQYSSNPFGTNYSQLPPQLHQRQIPTININNTPRNPFAVLQPQQQTPLPPPPPAVSSDQIILLLDQQVQMLHDSVRSFQSSYKQSRSLLQTKLNQEVEMMEAIVRQYQRTVTDQQRSQQAAVDRLNQQLELLHATCRVSQLGGGGQ